MLGIDSLTAAKFYSFLQQCSVMFLFTTNPAEFSYWESLWSRYSFVLVKSLSGWHSVCFSWIPWCSWGLMSHLVLDNDPGAVPIPGPLLLSSFISKGIQHALLNMKWLSRTLLRFAECFDQCCIPLLIYPISPSKTTLPIQEKCFC